MPCVAVGQSGTPKPGYGARMNPGDLAPRSAHRDPLLSTLAEAMAHLVAAMDTSTDDEADPDAASRWFEHPAYLFDCLSAEDRRRLADLFREAAMKEQEGPWRDALLDVPDGFGLDEDEG